jgi:hypothetical protein
MIRKLIGYGLACLTLFMIACFEEQEATVFSYSYSFKIDDQGWTGDFADYPEGDSISYELVIKRDTIPTGTSTNSTTSGLLVSGNNGSDDLFMFIKKKITGLQPNTKYELMFNVRLSSKAPTGSFGIGGAPGESVYLKVGASLNEPKKELDAGSYRMNIDKGNQSTEGLDMINVGHVGVAATTTKYTTISRNNNSNNAFTIKTDSSGEIWVIVGTDSGYEGKTTLYYTQIEILINKAD